MRRKKISSHRLEQIVVVYMKMQSALYICGGLVTETTIGMENLQIFGASSKTPPDPHFQVDLYIRSVTWKYHLQLYVVANGWECKSFNHSYKAVNNLESLWPSSLLPSVNLTGQGKPSIFHLSFSHEPNVTRGLLPPETPLSYLTWSLTPAVIGKAKERKRECATDIAAQIKTELSCLMLLLLFLYYFKHYFRQRV